VAKEESEWRKLGDDIRLIVQPCIMYKREMGGGREWSKYKASPVAFQRRQKIYSPDSSLLLLLLLPLLVLVERVNKCRVGRSIKGNMKNFHNVV